MQCQQKFTVTLYADWVIVSNKIIYGSKVSLAELTYLLGFNSFFSTMLVNPSRPLAEAAQRSICLHSTFGFDVDTTLLMDALSLLPDFVSTKAEEANLEVVLAVKCDDTIDNLSLFTLSNFWARMQPWSVMEYLQMYQKRKHASPLSLSLQSM